MKEFDLKVLNEKLNTLDFNTNETTTFIKERFLDLFEGNAFTIEKAKTFIKSQEKNLLEENLKLHRNLQTTSEQINKAFELSFKKNNEQVLKYHKTAEANISLKQNDLRALKAEINKAIKDEEKEFNDKIIDVQKLYEEELTEINKEIKKFKNQSNIETMRLENEFDEKIVLIKEKYNEQTLNINEQIQILKVNARDEITVFEEELKHETGSKDLSYLTIKKTHNTSSITLNNFINEIKKRYEEDFKKLDQVYNNTINDLKIEIDDLRDYHERAKETIIEEHNHKLDALNVVFDVQKSSHKTLNDEIIKNYNNEISKINADLRATKDNISLQITKLEEEKALKTKDLTDILEIDKINRYYNREINKVNKKLLQLINKNDQDILTAEIVFQANLFEHDSTNIKHLNEWRHIKNIYDKERELDYNTAVKKIEIELFNLTEKEKLVNLEYKLDKENLNANLEIELLPIESQLYLASLLQNRDINLLNIEFDSFKLNNELQTTVITKELNLKLEKLENELILLKENYLYNKKLLTLVNQLDVEKALIQRDTNLEVLNYQIRLQEYLLELKTTRLTNDFDNFKLNHQLNLDKQSLEFDYFRKSEKKRAFIEQNKRSTIIDEIKNKNQRTLNTLRNQRNINITKNEAEMHEQINIYYLDYVLDLFKNQEKSFDYLLKLIKEPVNPSLTRDTLKLLKDYNSYLLNDFKKAINDYLSYNKYHFNLIITSNTNNKYQLKHENILDDYNDSIEIISQNRKSINERINTLIEDNKIFELEINQNNIQLEQFAKISSDISLVNELKNHNRKLTRNLRNNEKLIKNLYKQRKPLEQSILERTKIKEREEAKLQKSKLQEQKKYLNTIKRYESDFNTIGEYITTLSNDLNNYYLQIENNTYLNDQTLNQLVKKINKIFTKINDYIIKHFTKLLNFWLTNYINTKTINERIINTFNLSTERALIKIDKNYEKFIKYENREKMALESIFKNKLESIKNDLQKLNDTKNQTRKSSNDLYNIKYENINQSISNLKAKSERKQKLINENLHYANNEYKRQLTKTINNAKSNLKKSEIKLLTDITYNKKEIDLNISRTNHRADVIINRFNNERTKHLKNMNLERSRYLTLITRNNELIEKELINLSTNSKYNAKKTQHTINHYKVLLRNYRRNSLKEKRQNIRKETKVLKKNYRFKQKEIYYHAKKA